MQSSSSNLERSSKRYDLTLASLHESAGVALFGGSFDPVHRGHLAIAEAALALGVVDRVVFIPSAQSPLKGRSPYASQAHRLAMLHLVAERDDFAVDTVELYRGASVTARIRFGLIAKLFRETYIGSWGQINSINWRIGTIMPIY